MVWRSKKFRMVCAVVVVTPLALVFLTPSMTSKREQVITTTTLTMTDTQHFQDRQVQTSHITQQKALEQPKRCSPAQSVAFVKTHKAGSSTIANILQRFGISRNLSFVLPSQKYHSSGYNYISRRVNDVLVTSKLHPLPDGATRGYNILCQHAVYDRTIFRHIMAANTVYISILREPFSQFVSAFEYYKTAFTLSRKDRSILQSQNPLSTYLENPYKYENSLHYFSYIKNKQSEDLGFGWKEYYNPRKFTEYLETINQDFILIMIMEYFDESLLLLKRKLCWDLQDILYIPKNKNTQKPKRNFTAQDRAHHRKISRLDYKLYDYFLQTLNDELQKQPSNFQEELSYFKSLLVEVSRSCHLGQIFIANSSQWNEEFTIDKAECRLLLMSELKGLDLLLERAGAFS